MGSACLFLSLVTMGLNGRTPVGRALLHGQRVSGILVGSDYEDNARHSDTLMWISYDPQSRFLDVLSIPRDTIVSVPGLPRVRRINEIFAYEFRRSGRDFSRASQALRAFVETMLSSGAVSAVAIPFYFTIDYEGFRSLIDAMGGIYVRVTEPMHYDDNWGHLHIHFEPGQYWMNGHNALLYVRFRGSSADQGRVLRQQIFVQDVLRRLKSPVLLGRMPRFARTLAAELHTNFSVWDLFNLLLEGRHMQWKNLRLFSLPGSPAGVLWKMDPEKTRRIVALVQAPAPREKLALSSRTRQALESRGATTVEVWNASSRSYAARSIMELLRDRGFDVVLYGNYATRQERTLVIDRSGRLREAQAVAEVLQTDLPAGPPGLVEVVSRMDPSRQVDVSVILGEDLPLRYGH